MLSDATYLLNIIGNKRFLNASWMDFMTFTSWAISNYTLN